MHKSLGELNVGQIPPLNMELAALERLKNRRHHFFSVAIDPILLKLTSNEDMHNILHESNFGQIGQPTSELAALDKIPIHL